MTELLAGKYELLRRIGSGGMADVWSAIQHGEAGLRRPVAVKRMLPALADNTDFTKMFLEEARIVSSLDHPNIVSLVDFCEAGDERLIVLELVDGMDFGRWILEHARRREPTPWTVVAAVGIDVLRALTAAHERRDESGRPAPVFHRDVTPSNILLSKYGTVKLGDFGVARAMDRVTLTTPGVVKGKLAYVAPEIVGGERAGPSTDLYSLGVVLWEALAMRRLFNGVSELELFVKVGQAAVPSLREERHDVPDSLHAVIEPLVAKSPHERFESARVAQAALTEALRAEGAFLTTDELARSVEETRASAEAHGAQDPRPTR